MNDLSAGCALFAVSGAWLALPLLPTLKEWLRATDDLPFQIIQENPFNPFHFADEFAERIESMRDTIDQCRTRNQSGTWYFENGRACRITACPDGFLKMARAEREAPVVVVCSPAKLVEPSEFPGELFITDNFTCGEGMKFFALLCDGEATLGPRTTVSRWAHARSSLCVGEGSVLRGRLTSEKQIHLGGAIAFERLHAPRIDFGAASGCCTASFPDVPQQEPHSTPKAARSRTLVQGDLLIDASRVWTGDFVVKGRLTVAGGSRIAGSIKGYENVQIGAGAVVLGSVVSPGNIELGRECSVIGPVISEKTVLLGPGCQVGTERQPTTISALNIRATAGAIAFGTAWARERGYVEN